MQFATLVEEHIMRKYPDARLYELSDEDHRKIRQMVERKYGTWEWNFGYSPSYNFRKVIRTQQSGTLEFNLDVSEGQIRHIKIFGDYFNIRETEEIENALTGILHSEKATREAIFPFNLTEYFNNISADEFIEGMF
jgi:lipoate-protein ligase A